MTCANNFIEEATPSVWMDKTVTNGSAFAPDSEVKFKLYAEQDWTSSTGAVVNAVVSDLLPAELDFVSWDTFSGNWATPGLPEPNMEVIKDYKGTGRTLVRFSWAATAPAGSVKRDGSAGIANPANIPLGGELTFDVTAKVKPGTVGGYLYQ